ncbi:hypothetical protein JUJ52_02980 [Virgibacillus sp. AGTR]|uniref:hypothetical protein n=1 Tax=Virgibacillus sp. AGTR TaxID=2812055 RepID=UPI001D160163|nr:hypothetical protein [Virgibacillus sp. AGTR]MCC2248921.1 hypothetical protein [Virgibacillus sp. AGTR]
MLQHYQVQKKHDVVTIKNVAYIKQSKNDVSLFDQNDNIIAMFQRDSITNIVPTTTLPATEEQLVSKTSRGDLQYAGFRYKNMSVHALYSRMTGVVYVKKGALVMKEMKNSIHHQTGYQHIRDLREQLIPAYVEDHDEQYYQLTQNIEFNSLAQALTTLTGAGLSAKQYWKINENHPPINHKLHIVKLHFEDLTANGIYNEATKTVIIKRGSLMMKEIRQSLSQSNYYSTIINKRNEIIQGGIENHNENCCRILQDIEFSSLSQASAALTGAKLNMNYWKFIDSKK